MKIFGRLVLLLLLVLLAVTSFLLPPLPAQAGSYVVGQYTYASGTTDYALGVTGQTVCLQKVTTDGKLQIKHWSNSGDVRLRFNPGSADEQYPLDNHNYTGNATGTTFKGYCLVNGGFAHFIGASHADIDSFATANP